MKNFKRAISAALCFILICVFPITTVAHSGRTDSSGGHHDYKNKSGLGSYHYHHGYSAHLHPDGICPYAPKDKITVSGYNSTMYIGDKQSFEYDIESAKSYVYPSITSSDNSVVSVEGKSLTAKSAGTATITVTTSNNISKEVDINIFEIFPEEIKCEDTVKLIVGDTYKLPIEILPKNANNKDFTVVSSDNEVLKYTENTIEAVKEGKVTLHIETWNGVKKDIPVQIDIIPVENIEIKDSTEYIASNIIDKSDEILLTTEITPNNATYQNVTWESSDNDIVKVEDGNFIVNGTGTVILTCSSHNGITNSVEIMVFDKTLIDITFVSVAVGIAGATVAVVKRKNKR